MLLIAEFKLVSAFDFSPDNGLSFTDCYGSNWKLPHCCLFDSGAEVWNHVCPELAGTIQVRCLKEWARTLRRFPSRTSVFQIDFAKGRVHMKKVLEGTLEITKREMKRPEFSQKHLWHKCMKAGDTWGGEGREQLLMPLVSSWDNDSAICCIGRDCSLWNMKLEMLCDTEGSPEEISCSFVSSGDLLFSLYPSSIHEGSKGLQDMSKANLESQLL